MSTEKPAPSSAIHSYQVAPIGPGGFMTWNVSLFARAAERKQEHVGVLLLAEKDADKVDTIAAEVCAVLDQLFKANRQ